MVKRDDGVLSKLAPLKGPAGMTFAPGKEVDDLQRAFAQTLRNLGVYDLLPNSEMWCVSLALWTLAELGIHVEEDDEEEPYIIE